MRLAARAHVAMCRCLSVNYSSIQHAVVVQCVLCVCQCFVGKCLGERENDLLWQILFPQAKRVMNVTINWAFSELLEVCTVIQLMYESSPIHNEIAAFEMKPPAIQCLQVGSTVKYCR